MDVPATVRTPVSVMAPVEVTARLPVAVVVFNATAPVAATVMFLPVKVKSPVKAFVVLLSDRSFVPASIVVVPVIVNLPVLVIAAVFVTDRLPPTVIVARFNAAFEVIVKFLPAAVVAPTPETLVRVNARSPVVPVTVNESAPPPPVKAIVCRLAAVAFRSVCDVVPTVTTVEFAPAVTVTASALFVPVTVNVPEDESKAIPTTDNIARDSSISMQAGT